MTNLSIDLTNAKHHDVKRLVNQFIHDNINSNQQLNIITGNCQSISSLVCDALYESEYKSISWFNYLSFILVIL